MGPSAMSVRTWSSDARMMPNAHSAIRLEARFVSDTGASTTTATRSGYFVIYSFRIVNPR